MLLCPLSDRIHLVLWRLGGGSIGRWSVGRICVEQPLLEAIPPTKHPAAARYGEAPGDSAFPSSTHSRPGSGGEAIVAVELQRIQPSLHDTVLV